MNSLDAHLGQIVYDKDGVADWCIVLLEMLLTRFEELNEFIASLFNHLYNDYII